MCSSSCFGVDGAVAVVAQVAAEQDHVLWSVAGLDVMEKKPAALGCG
jgi:hypothetical protein